MTATPHATEHAIQQKIHLALGQRPDLRIWRQNTGQAWTGSQCVMISTAGTVHLNPGDCVIRKAHPIRFGLPGGSDLLGIMAPVGRILAVEVKSATGRQSEQQHAFQVMIERFGGVYILARSVAEAETGIQRVSR